MKSFLSQGKTIGLAIEKAIKSANYPNFFTIKIVEQGNKSIFWWLAKDAIIVFSYEDDKSKKFNNNNIHKKNVFLYKNHSFHDEPSVTSIIQHNKKNNNNQNKEYSQKKKKTIDPYKNNSNTWQSNKDNQESQSAIFTEKTEKMQIKKSREDLVNERRRRFQDKDINQNQHSDVKRQGQREPQKNVHNDQDYKKFSQKDKEINSKYKAEKVKHTIEMSQEEEIKNKIIQKNELANVSLKESVVDNVQSTSQIMWKESHLIFVREWIENLNSYLRLTSVDITYKVDEKKLTIMIHAFDKLMEKDKKYLYSSIVLLLYQALQKQFPGSFINEYKIIIE